MDNNKIDPRAFQAETVYEQQMAGVVGAGPSMANEAASVAQLTDEQIDALYFQCVSDSCVGKSFRHAFARALLAQAAPPAAPVQGDALTDERELDLYDEIECDLPALFGRASLEGHEAGQRLAKQVQKKMQNARALLAAPAAPASEQVVYELYGISDIMRGSAQQDNEPRCDVCGAKTTDPWLDHRGCQQLASAPQDEREAFEAWAGDWFFGGVVRCGEGYAINSINSAWYSWQARSAQQVQAGGEDKRDAERYRWLQFSGYSEIYLHNQPGLDNCKDIGGDALDAAIDAALSREQPQPSNGDREGGV